METADKPVPPEPVLLIHGTFASHEEEDATPATKNRWWLRGSEFCESINATLHPGAECTPKGKWDSRVLPWWRHLSSWMVLLAFTLFTGLAIHFGLIFGPILFGLIVGIFVLLWCWRLGRLTKGWFPSDKAGRDTTPEAVFHWSGDNRESARRSAGRLLLEHLQRFDRLGRPFHVIGHSHGGSVLWEALCLSVSWKDSLRKRGNPANPPLKHLASWTTVGTPFMHFRPDLWRLLAAFPLTAVGVIIWLQWAWLRDYWTQFHMSISQPWGWKLFAFALSCLTLVLVVALLLRFWSAVVRVRQANQNPRMHETVRKREYDNVWSTLIACLTIFLILWALYSLPQVAASVEWVTLIWWRVPRLWPLPLLPLLSLAWLLVAGGTFLYLLASVISPLWQAIALWWRRRRRSAAWDYYGFKCHCFALSDRDEAILGLRAARRGFQGELLPRFPSPIISDFSEPNGRLLRRPEREYQRQSLSGWLFHYVLLPTAILRDWIIYPVYNGVFAALIDSFVLGQMRKRAAGCDIAGLQPDDVTDQPFRASEMPATPAKAVFPPQGREDLQESTTSAAAAFLDYFRERLFRYDSPVALNLSQFLREAMQGENAAAAPLVHTSYFPSTGLQEDLANVICNRPTGGEPVVPPDPITPGADRRAKDFANLIVRYVAGVCQLVVAAVFLSAPAGLVYVLGYYVTYPFSREYLVEWASRTELPLGFAADLHPEDQDEVPPIARWWVANKLVHPEAQVKAFGDKIQSGKGNSQIAKRVYFYAKVGETFAQINKRDWAVDAFKQARSEIGNIVVSPNDPTAALGSQSNLATGMVWAERYLGEAPGSLDKEVFAGAPPNEKIPNLNALRADANQRSSFWGEAFEAYRTAKGTPDVVQRRSYFNKAIAGYNKRRNVAERVNGMAFLLRRAQELGVDPSDYMDEFVKAVYELRDSDLTAPPSIQKERSILAIVSVASTVPVESKRILVEAAFTILPSILNYKDPKTSVAAYISIAELRHDLGDEQSVEELLSKALEIKDATKGQSQEVQTRIVQLLVRGYVRRGDYKRAKDLADEAGRAAQLEAATQLLAAEAKAEPQTLQDLLQWGYLR